MAHKKEMTFRLTDVIVDAGGCDKAAAMAHFLLENTGSIFGCWVGRLPASVQRILFGRFIGKGRIYVNGNDETVEMWVSVCFGGDYDRAAKYSWRDLLKEA